MNPADNPDRLEDVLDNWRRWMESEVTTEGAGGPDGLPRRSAVLSTGGTSKSFDDMCVELDLWLAETTNAAIDSLPDNQGCALHNHYLHAVYTIRDYQGTLTLARAALRRLLIARNVYL